LALLRPGRFILLELGDRVASDELDWWMLYLQTALYVEEEDLEVRVRYASLTDPLDAYYMYVRGERSEKAPKPRQPLGQRFKEVLEFLDERRPPGLWPQPATCSTLPARPASGSSMT
jgi:hypothetical protein